MEAVPVHRVDKVLVGTPDLRAAEDFYGSLLGTDFYELRDETVEGRSLLSMEGLQLVERDGPERAFAMALRVPDLDAAADAMLRAGLVISGKSECASWRGVLFEDSRTCGVSLQLVEYLPAYSVAELEVVSAWRDWKGLGTPLRLRPPAPAIKTDGIDHVLIYVSDIFAAREAFGSLIRTRFPEPHTHGARGSLLSVDGLGIELIGSNDPQGGVARAIARDGEGIAAVSFRVSDFDQAVAALEARGHEPIAERQLPSRRVALYHAARELTVGIELIAYRPLAHPLVCGEMATELRRR